MNTKEWKPFFIEDSSFPKILSKVAPINVWAFSFGIWVWCRGKLSEKTKRHETIHFQQQLEMAFIFQWLLYATFHLVGLIIYRNGEMAYRNNPFEREAYSNDSNELYLSDRARFSWVKYIFEPK